MASELIVQTIQGPSSGANANKVIIPSGHTLDASAGFIPPAGTIVQTVQYQFPRTVVTMSANSFTSTGHYLDITTKYDNSKILVNLAGGGWYDNGYGNASLWVSFQRSVSGGSNEWFSNTYNDNYGLIRMSGDGGSWNIKPFACSATDTLTEAAGTTIRYLVVARQSINSSQYQSSDRGAPTLTLQEIKQ